MQTENREVLKEQLRLMAAGRGDGIDLETAERWAVEGLRDPVAFFRQLDRLIPADGILYIEVHNVVREAADFYERFRACKGATCVVLDMIYPVPEIFHLQLQPGVIEGFVHLLSKYSQPDCLTQLKAYRDGKLLFSFHDAFDGSDLLVSDEISAERVKEFCGSVGAAFRREPNENKRHPEVLRRLLWAMENPSKVRLLWPWWKKALLFWKK